MTTAEREREREREREIERQTWQTQMTTDRQTWQRQMTTAGRERESRQTDQTDRPDRQTDQTDRPDRQTRQTDQTDRPDRQTRQTDQTDRQTTTAKKRLARSPTDPDEDIHEIRPDCQVRVHGQCSELHCRHTTNGNSYGYSHVVASTLEKFWWVTCCKRIRQTLHAVWQFLSHRYTDKLENTQRYE